MTILQSLHEELESYFHSLSRSIPKLRDQYLSEDYVEIVDFVPKRIHAATLEELEALFAEKSKRRDLVIPITGNTPRRYTNLDRDAIAKGSKIIPALYLAPGLVKFLEAIVGEKVLPVPYRPEEFIASRLHMAGDVHGWHWDDYTWALVWVFKMPAPEQGGSLEFVKRVPWNRDDPQVDRLVGAGPLARKHPVTGNAYLLKANTSLHRVAPLTTAAERMIVCYSYATEEDLQRSISHETMEVLYPESHQRHHGGYRDYSPLGESINA